MTPLIYQENVEGTFRKLEEIQSQLFRKFKGKDKNELQEKNWKK